MQYEITLSYVTKYILKIPIISQPLICHLANYKTGRNNKISIYYYRIVYICIYIYKQMNSDYIYMKHNFSFTLVHMIIIFPSTKQIQMQCRLYPPSLIHNNLRNHSYNTQQFWCVVLYLKY